MVPLTYEALWRQARRGVLRHTLLRGPGGPLVFVWSVGLAGEWLLILELPVYAVIWTAVVGCLIALAVVDALHDPKTVAALASKLYQKSMASAGVHEPHHQEAIGRGMDVLILLVTKVEEIKKSRRSEGDLLDDLREVVSRASMLLSLQYESARQATELRRVLRVIETPAEARQKAVRQREPGDELEGVSPARLRMANLAAVRREAGEADDLVREIGQRLETLLLQVLQMERRPIDVVTSAEARRESAESLEHLQRLIDARRDAAIEVMDLLAPRGAAARGLTSER